MKKKASPKGGGLKVGSWLASKIEKGHQDTYLGDRKTRYTGDGVRGGDFFLQKGRAAAALHSVPWLKRRKQKPAMVWGVMEF